MEAPGTAPGSSPLITQPFIAIVRANPNGHNITAAGQDLKVGGMGRFWKWAGIGLGAAAAAALAATAYIYFASERIVAARHLLPPSDIRASSDPAVIAQGAGLVWVYGCTDCHGDNLAGQYTEDFGMSSRNLTRLARTLSAVDLDRIIRHGLRPNGTSVAEYMPSDSFRYMPDADVVAIVSYLRSLKPLGSDIPEPRYGLPARWEFLRGRKKMDAAWFAEQKPALDVGAKYARAREMAMSACGECHMTSLEGRPGDGPNLVLVASYDRADFLKLMRTGKAAGNREAGFMSRTARQRFRHFTDAEANALYDYLAARGRKLTGSSE